MLKKLFTTPLHLATMSLSILLLTSCAGSRPEHPPTPLDGVDLYDGKNKGDLCFSSAYLENYLQWKHDNCQK